MSAGGWLLPARLLVWLLMVVVLVCEVWIVLMFVVLLKCLCKRHVGIVRLMLLSIRWFVLLFVRCFFFNMFVSERVVDYSALSVAGSSYWVQIGRNFFFLRAHYS